MRWFRVAKTHNAGSIFTLFPRRDKWAAEIELKYSLHKRLIGSVASLAAAYALVLNVVLSSMLLASLSPTALAAGTEICAASAVYGIAHDNAGQSDADQAPGAVAAHCPVCVFAHLPGTPPP